MKSIKILIICTLFANATFACGNSYFFEDMPMPYKNGFLDYEKIFVSSKTSHDSLENLYRRSNVHNPYFFPVNASDFKWNSSIYQDQTFNKLRDTIIKLLGDFKKNWILSNKNIVHKAIAKNIDYKILSDFAWQLAKKRDYKLAQNLLLHLDAKHPNEYNIMANLGTVYELQGKNNESLYYIAKAVLKSPQSHYGSEWLHINILKKKMELIIPINSYNDFFEMNNYAKFSYSNQLYKASFKPEEMGKYHRDTLMVHLAYQLHERMYFIEKNDEIMAEMLFMFMQCMIHRGDDYYAAEIGKLVLLYDSTNASKKVFDAMGYCIKKRSLH